MKNTKIQWCDHTFNPWWGCAKVSPGCAHCYAEALTKRTGHGVWGADAPRRFFADKHWAEPLLWNADALKDGVRARVFCASMADVFEDRADLDDARFRLFQLIDDTPHLDWLLLTKRPENIARLMLRVTNGSFGEAWNFRDHMPNVWLGTTVEDQERADARVPELVRIPAKVRFLSCEPLLGAVDIWGDEGTLVKAEDSGVLDDVPFCRKNPYYLDWVICGGESGGGARVMNPEWARSLRDQCSDAGVPFFFKQWGPRGADRLLDGQEWNEFPHTRRTL